jgi:phosphatidylserine decarboxylase
MGFILQPIPEPECVAALKPLLSHRTDAAFHAQLLESLKKAHDQAKNGGLNKALYEALPLEGMTGWPLTFDEYVRYLCIFSRWIPHQTSDKAWEKPTNLAEHQEVYDYLCWFYWLIDQPINSLDGGVLQDIPWFADFLVLWAREWGLFLDSTDSFNDEVLESFLQNAPEYRVRDSMIPQVLNPEKLRANDPSGRWLSFNQFFARQLNPGLRPITHPLRNSTLTAPADCTFKKAYAIDETGKIKPEIVIKGTHTYATVQQLLDKSIYADAFNGGHFIHFFLGPYSYHRFHTPVGGKVIECYPLTGQVYLQVSLSNGQFEVADSAEDGYEFVQSRGVLTIDTTGSPYGDVGIVAVIPIGMSQVSGVNMTHQAGTECSKGEEFGYFTFGGSDIIVLTQKGTNPQWNPAFVEGTRYYSHYGTLLGRVTPFP